MNQSVGIHEVESVELSKRKKLWEELGGSERKSYARTITIKTKYGANIEITLFGGKDNLAIIDNKFEESLDQYAKEQGAV